MKGKDERQILYYPEEDLQCYLSNRLMQWSEFGRDAAGGGFWELFDWERNPLPQVKRARLAARQLYCFCLAFDRKLLPVESLEELTYFLTKRFVSPRGRAFKYDLVHPDSNGVNQGHDLYDDAFVLFALGQLARRNILPDLVLHTATRLVSHVCETASRPDGSFSDDSYEVLANPNMHLLEAFLLWAGFDSPLRASASKLARDLANCAIENFRLPGCNALPEVYDGELTPKKRAAGFPVEPGHQYEWAWLLLLSADRLGVTGAYTVSHSIAAFAERYGLSKKHGLDFVVNQVNERGRIVDGSCKLWPLAERLKYLAYAAANGYEVSVELANTYSSLEWFLKSGPTWGWLEAVDEEGERDTVSVKASSFYHFACALEFMRSGDF